MDPIVSLRGVNHAFGEGATRRQVLDDVCADVLPGEIVIITGPSGSGKTTLLTLVGGLRSLQEGSIGVLGHELAVALLHTLAQDRACAILLVTHDSRIVDIADRILTLEDGRLTSASSGLATHTEYVLNALQRRGELQRQAAMLPPLEFVRLLDGFSSEFEQLTRTLDSARDEVAGLLVDDTVDTIARKLRQVFRVERTSVYLMDADRRTLRSKAAWHNGARGLEVTVPVGVRPAGR